MNWLALIVGALVPMILGFIWYHKSLFGNAWMNSIGKTEEELKAGGNMALTMILSLLLAAALAYFLIGQLGIHDYFAEGDDGYAHNFGHGAYHGMWIGLLTAVPVLVTNSLFEQKSWNNIFINAAYWVLAIALMGGVISLFL